jgi:hypothetical protein
MSEIGEFRPQRLKIVYFTIKYDGNRLVFIIHRLVPAGGVNDRQTAMAKPDSGLDMAAIAIRTAVPDSVSHRLKRSDFRRLICCFGEDTGDAAHAACSVFVVAGKMYPIGGPNRSRLPALPG